jgi:hypothetical protein
MRLGRSRLLTAVLASFCDAVHDLAVGGVRLLVLTAALSCSPWPAHAQEVPGEASTAEDSRAATLRAAREQKQQELEPPHPNVLERGLKALERGGVPLITRDGLYAKLGSLTTGSGFAYGAGYRTRRFFDRDAGLDLWAGATMTQYWAAQARLQVPLAPDGRIVLNTYGRRHDYPQEDFFGIGPDSVRADHTTFRMLATTVGARVNGRLAGPLAVGGGVEYLTPSVGDGKDQSVPPIGDVFDDHSAPGLDSQPDFVRTLAFVDVDWRAPRNARRGGWYRAEFSHYEDRDQNLYSFDRFDLDARQFFSVLSERRIFVARAFISTSHTPGDQTMPFYLMPSLGGNDSLRGFREYRFRGPHALLLQGEYRFEIWSGLDAALFYDTGKVATRRQDLDLNGLESDYGFGFRFNTDNGLILRVDSAFGSRDGKHLWVVFGGTF